jgi:hypothetical protein
MFNPNFDDFDEEFLLQFYHDYSDGLVLDEVNIREEDKATKIIETIEIGRYNAFGIKGY